MLSKSLVLLLSPELLDRLHRRKRETGTSVSEFIRRAIKGQLDLEDRLDGQRSVAQRQGPPKSLEVKA
jgi:hypothetical protein